jgi:hypothetical protein
MSVRSIEGAYYFVVFKDDSINPYHRLKLFRWLPPLHRFRHLSVATPIPLPLRHPLTYQIVLR